MVKVRLNIQMSVLSVVRILHTLTADALHYEFPDESLIDEYWNGKEWDIDPRDYDVDHEPIKIYTPTTW